MAFASLGTAFAFAGGSFPGTKGDCGTMLAAGATCSVDILFTPTTAGDFSALLSLTYNDGSATQGASRTLIGQGIDGARLTITDWSGGGSNNGGPSTSERGASPPATPSPSGTRGTSPRPC